MPMTEYAESGTAVADHQNDEAQATTSAAASTVLCNPIHGCEISEIAAVPVLDIFASPFNPRQANNATADQELVESIMQVGVLEPVLLRNKPMQPGDNPFGAATYELVFGHRRWRAAREAGLESIPAMIRDLDDAESALLQAVENLQREDLTVMDEARGYAAFIQANGINKDQLAERIGKSRTHVYNRLKLAELQPAAADALLAGKINASTAEQIARIPAKHQNKALAIALETFPFATKRSFRKVRDELLEKFTLDLKTAIFDTSDAVLLELAGACTTCPKRSGQTPELYGDLIKRDEPLYKWGKAQHGSADICTDPDCFAEKKKAHLANQRAEMEVKGAKVVGGSAAMAAIDAYGNVKGAYIALGDVRAEIKKLADDKKPEVVTIQNPRNGQTVKAVKRADLADAGAKVEKHAKVQDKWTVDQKAREQDRAKLAAEAAALTAQNMRLLAAVRAAAASLPRTALDLQLIALTTWDGTAYQAKCTLAQLYGFQKPDELATCISGMDVNALGLFCLDCALVEDVEVSIYHLDTKPEALLRAAEHYGVDLNAPAGEEPATVPADALADDPTT